MKLKTHTQNPTTFSLERPSLWARLRHHQAAMSAEALCSPQEAIRSQQLPFQPFNGAIVSEAYQMDPLPEIPIGSNKETIFFIITTPNFFPSGYILCYSRPLFITLACIAQ